MQNSANDSGGGIFCHYYSNPTFVNCVISENSLHGIYCDYWTSPTFDSCEIVSNTGDGFQFNYLHDTYIHYCDIVDNTGYGVRNFLDSIWVDAEYNWWGDATGPFHPDSNPGGLGDSVSDYVDFIPWLGGPVGIYEEPGPKHKTKDMRLLVSPNPFSASTQLSISDHQNIRESELQIYNASGRLVKSVKVKTATYQLGADLVPGIYFLELNGKSVGKVVKVR